MKGKPDFPYVFLSDRTVCCAVKLCPGGRVDDFPALVLHPGCSGLPRGSHRSLQPTNLIRFAFTTASGSMHGNRILLFPRKRRKCDVSGFEPRVRGSALAHHRWDVAASRDGGDHIGHSVSFRLVYGHGHPVPEPTIPKGFFVIAFLLAFVTGL